MHLGYRRRKTDGGSWTARRFLGTFKFFEHSLGFTGSTEKDLRMNTQGNMLRESTQIVVSIDWGHPFGSNGRHACLFNQPIETTSKRPIIEWRDFAPCAAPLFAGAPEILGTSFNYIRDEKIYGEGEDTQFVYKIVAGAVRTSKIMRDGRRQIGRFYLPSEFFGFEFRAASPER